ncbi:pimeloyl-ACP methyl ester carboxylesterase [Rhodococcus erythropolis]|uniref:alpha/beta fold hydrolase n=1 Tax=Rhodococcus erythropolis TaxID=1833 RepID=UPI002167B76B|nr:alpha/beta hydrolase [Rhodococcus erythropolis]MCS4255910.1 pimeloyl-ACP methyl ester carboxylesterase [Rhodococcus erythropolis]MCW2425427.1 pimeloyl-ACP methyl ester carboxylesterase [Rhodococcus erythropolis]
MSVTGPWKLHHRIAGENTPTLVLIHGFGGSHRWWNRITPLLAPWRTISVDLLGHGLSSRAYAGYSPTAQAAAIHELLDNYEIERAVPVGHSMGFDVAIALAERLTATDRVPALVGLDEGPTPEYATFPRGHRIVRSRLLGPLLKAISPDLAVLQGYRTAFAPGFKIDPELRSMLIEDYRAQPFESFRGNLEAKTEYARTSPFDRRIEKLDLPTLMIFGERDQLWSPRSSIERYSAIRNMEVHTLPHSGHTPIIEAPVGSAVAITEFLDNHVTLDD